MLTYLVAEYDQKDYNWSIGVRRIKTIIQSTLAKKQVETYNIIAWFNHEQGLFEVTLFKFEDLLKAWEMDKTSKETVIQLLCKVQEFVAKNNTKGKELKSQNIEVIIKNALTSVLDSTNRSITSNIDSLMKQIKGVLDEKQGEKQDIKSLINKINSQKVILPDIEELAIRLAEKITIPDQKAKQDVKVKISELPKFHGSLSDNFTPWLYLIDNVQKSGNYGDKDMILRIMPLLRGHALDILIKFQKESDNPDSWNNFRKC